MEEEVFSFRNPPYSPELSSPSAGFKNNSILKLFNPACPFSIRPVDFYLRNIPVDQPAAPARFDLGNEEQKRAAEKLKTFLDGMGFDRINQAVDAENYGHTPIYDNDFSADDIQFKLAAHPQLTRKQKNAFLFFMYGKGLSDKELKEVFAGQTELFARMQAMNLIVAEKQHGEVLYRLNDLSLASQKLPNNKTMYLFLDLPKRLRPSQKGSEPTAQISETSYFLLNRLMRDYEFKVKREGLVADFGAGTGIQAIALLMMYPEIREAISLEIDERSMNLNRFNAMINGVSDRVQVIDNVKPQNFQRALRGRKLDLAVSNPPFNIVPHEYETQFTEFGYGGDHGIDITKIFLKQALPVLKKNGEFIYYSFLAQNEKGEYFVTRYLKENFRGLNLRYESADGRARVYMRAGYARGLADFIVEHGLSSSQSTSDLAQDIETKLKEDGVRQLDEKIGVIIQRRDGGPVQPQPGLLVEFKLLEPFQGGIRETLVPAEPRKGGVYLQRRIQSSWGGERIHEGGVYLQDSRIQSSLGGERIRRLSPAIIEFCKKDPECVKLLPPLAEPKPDQIKK